MTDVMKQRLIGSLLLLCAFALIALYLVNSASFEEESESVDAEPLQISKEFQSSVQVVYDENEIEEFIDLDSKKPVSVKNTRDDVELISEVVTNPQINPRNKKWVIQLASFTVLSNAEALNGQLVKQGYNAKIETSTTNGEPLYRVRVISPSSKENVDLLAKEIANKFNIQPQVFSHSD